MTKQEFINKWLWDEDDRDGMEFDLISVIINAEEERINKRIAEYRRKLHDSKVLEEKVGLW